MFQRFFIRYKQSFSGLPREAWHLSFIVFVNRSGTMVLFFLSLYLTRKLNYSIADAGRLISLYGLGALAGSLLGGWLSDKIGSARVQFLSLFFNGIGFIVLSFLYQPLWLGLALFVTAALGESFRPANSTALAEVCPPEKRSRGFALNRLAVNLGISVGPAVGGFLATVDYKFLFWVDGVTCILAALLLLFIFDVKRTYRPAKTTDKSASIVSPYRDLTFLFLLSLLFLTGLLFTQFFNTWPLYLRESYFLREDQIGLLVALNAVLVSIFEMPIIHRFEKKNPFSVILPGAILLFAGFAILPFGNGWLYGAFTVIVWSIGEMLVFPLTGGYIANRAQDSNRGTYMGLFSFVFSLSFVFGPSIGSAIYSRFGGDFLWFLSGIGGIVAAAGFYRLMNMEKHNY